MFASCLNPQRIYNSSLGQYIYTSCGNCEYCREQRRKVWARRLQLQSESSAYCLFFTLTYDNKFLPKVYYDEKGSVTDFVCSSERILYNRHTKERSTIQKIIHQDIYNGLNVFTRDGGDIIRPPHYVLYRLRDKAKTPIFSRENSFAVSYPKDFQNFIKRCRINLRRHYIDSQFDPSFTYFGVSEYGPETYRPHFHGLLFFSSYPPDVASLLSILSKSWSKSPLSKVGSEFTPVRTKIASAKYVSKYVCKDSSLPRILLTPEFCTRTFKSISVPLGSQSFNISDIPSIFAKGTLLYDSQYYDKEEHTFVPIKLSYPSVSWYRIFPKLLGRRLLSIPLLRSCFKRIFRYRACPQFLPNLVSDFSNKYPIGYLTELLDDDVVNEYILRSKGISDPFEFPELHNYYIKKRSLSVSRYKTATYSYFFNRLLSTDLDYFLFGIPQNLTFCRKVLANSLKYDFLSTVDDYLNYYLRYETIHFTDTIKYTHEHYDEIPSAYEFGSIYMDFYNNLYPVISDYDTEQITRLDALLANFGLSLQSFYDSDSRKINFDYNFQRDVDTRKFQQEDQAFRTKSAYISHLYEDL